MLEVEWNLGQFFWTSFHARDRKVGEGMADWAIMVEPSESVFLRHVPTVFPPTYI
jgi:hypothetical protein